MGLLKVGVPLPWDQSKKKSRYIRNAGVRQFISTYNRVKDLKGDELLWGDEIEYGIFHLDPEAKKIRLSLRGKEIMDELNALEESHSHRMEGCNWVPEYGAWMIESTPNRPYTGYTNDLLRVERNMRLRRKRLITTLGKNEIAPTVSSFPLLGTLGDDGSVPPTKIGGPFTESEYIGDGIINPHPRFGTLSKNIRQRRGSHVSIRVPLYRDVKTPEFENLQTSANNHGCCGSDAFQLWRYGNGDASCEKYGRDLLVIGCTSGTDEYKESQQEKLCKWLVNVNIEGCLGLFYRSSPDVIVPDADWPRNGDIVVGSEIPDIPGWIRLQNGYYLPMRSDDAKIPFLEKITDRVTGSKTESKNLMGSSTPIFRSRAVMPQKDPVAILDNIPVVIEKDSVATQSQPGPSLDLDRVHPAIHMDAMAFGMGCCCLQVTFQAKDVDESRFLYDQLAVLAPILMALTASSPIAKGRVADIDTRWGIISEAVDCRTPAERGRQKDEPDNDMAGKGQRRIYKSRYDSISSFIYQGMTDSEMFDSQTNNGLANRVLNMYNDIPVPLDQETYDLLRKNGIDPALSQHIAHLFIRDPLVVFDGSVEEVDDETQTEHFESIQSTNWNSVRWKPPPPRNDPNDPHIGWRTEFRSMEMQLTDFENAAFAVFIVLITRVILTFDLNLYVPLSRVEANMQRAHSRGAAAKGKFFFRRHMADLEEGDDGFEENFSSMFARVSSTADLKEKDNSSTSAPPSSTSNSSHTPSRRGSIDGISAKRRNAPCALGSSEENSYEEMTMAEIMIGKGDYYPGLIPLVFAYLDYINCDTTTMARLTQYLDLIQKRATGELMTAATWQRNFIRNHKAYKGDSVVNDEIAYDLMVACKEIGEGARHVPELLGDIKIEPITTAGAYDKKLDSTRVQNDEILKLLRRYTNRKSFSPVEEK